MFNPCYLRLLKICRIKGVNSLLVASLFLFFHSPSSLSGQFIPPDYSDPERREMHQIAIGVAMATALALVGVATYSACARHSSSGSSSSNTGNTTTTNKNNGVLNLTNDPNVTTTNNGTVIDGVVVTTSFPASYYDNDYFDIFENNDVVVNPGFNDFENFNVDDELLFQDENDATNQVVIDPLRAAALSGSIVCLLPGAGKTRGSLTMYVQLPDGTTKNLGNLPLSSNGGAGSLSYGPFYQKGTYYFGFAVDQGTKIPNKGKVASVNIDINGSIKERLVFDLPANPPENYEPALQSYHHF